MPHCAQQNLFAGSQCDTLLRFRSDYWYLIATQDEDLLLTHNNTAPSALGSDSISFDLLCYSKLYDKSTTNRNPMLHFLRFAGNLLYNMLYSCATNPQRIDVVEHRICRIASICCIKHAIQHVVQQIHSKSNYWSPNFSGRPSRSILVSCAQATGCSRLSLFSEPLT